MKAEDFRIIFLGTPDFAVTSLDGLVCAGMKVVAVVTAPDKPSGRGLNASPSAVKKYAVEKNIPVLQPEKLKDPGFIETLRSYRADIQVVVAFRMLPEIVWNMPPLGTINVHGSLLPQYRGAAPIHRAVMNGEKETGVTTFRLQHAIDTGGILMQASMPIGENENTGTIYQKLSVLGSEVLVKTIRGIASGELKEQPQENLLQEPLHTAPKIFTEDCIIHWNQPAKVIHNLIRGLSPSPGALTQLNGKTLKIYSAHPIVKAHTFLPGTIESDGKNQLLFATSDGWIAVQELQLEGKKRMTIPEFLRGYRIAPM
ncbi:MAG: methionyl-tRNA formyltransferase [Chitinophagia bacterium]|nr:methionyl-tRNA formyltransferase [Chitinophagia bacterium]